MTTAAEVKAARKANYAAQKKQDNGSRVRSGNRGTAVDEAGLRTIEQAAAILTGLTPPVMQGVAGLLAEFSLVRPGVYALALVLVPEEEAEGRPRIRSLLGEITPPRLAFSELSGWAAEIIEECYGLMPKNVIGNRLLEEPKLTGWRVDGPTAKKQAQLAARGLTAVPVGPVRSLTFRLARKGYDWPEGK